MAQANTPINLSTTKRNSIVSNLSTKSPTEIYNFVLDTQWNVKERQLFNSHYRLIINKIAARYNLTLNPSVPTALRRHIDHHNALVNHLNSGVPHALLDDAVYSDTPMERAWKETVLHLLEGVSKFVRTVVSNVNDKVNFQEYLDKAVQEKDGAVSFVHLAYLLMSRLAVYPVRLLSSLPLHASTDLV